MAGHGKLAKWGLGEGPFFRLFRFEVALDEVVEVLARGRAAGRGARGRLEAVSKTCIGSLQELAGQGCIDPAGRGETCRENCKEEAEALFQFGPAVIVGEDAVRTWRWRKSFGGRLCIAGRINYVGSAQLSGLAAPVGDLPSVGRELRDGNWDDSACQCGYSGLYSFVSRLTFC